MCRLHRCPVALALLYGKRIVAAAELGCAGFIVLPLWRDHLGELLVLLAGLKPMYHLKDVVLRLLVTAPLGIQALSFEAIVSEDLDRLVHLPDFVATTIGEHLDVVVLLRQSIDDAGHSEQRCCNPTLQDKIQNPDENGGG